MMNFQLSKYIVHVSGTHIIHTILFTYLILTIIIILIIDIEFSS